MTSFMDEPCNDLPHFKGEGSKIEDKLMTKSNGMGWGRNQTRTKGLCSMIASLQIGNLAILQGSRVESLWGDCKFIPADWGS